jgi:Na+/proline symporter
MTSLQTLVIIMTTIYLGVCVWVGYKTRTEIKDAYDYFLAGKTVTFWFLFFTTWASFSGAGNFVGYAGRAAMHGISAFWVYLGEVVLGYNVVAFLIAPHLAKFNYITMAHYMSDYLAGGDLFVRRIAGAATLLPNVCWVGGQIMALSYLYSMVFDINPKIIMVIVGAVVIYYTISGGFKAVVQTDFFQGIMQLALAVFIITYIVRVTGLNVSWISKQLVSQDLKLWQWTPGGILPHLSGFLVGFFGALSNPPMWNRAFAAKDVQTVKAYKIAMVITAMAVLFTLFMGLYARAVNPQVGDKATFWFVFNHTPMFVQALAMVCVMAACMSTADTHLNNGGANIMCDIIDPYGRMKAAAQVKYSRIVTAIAGIFAIGAALTFPSILDLGMFGYAICGGVLIPYFIIAYLYKDKNSKEFRSGLSVTASRAGLAAGAVVAVLFEGVPSLNKLLGGGIIPAIVVTTFVLLLVNLFTKSAVSTIPNIDHSS